MMRMEMIIINKSKTVKLVFLTIVYACFMNFFTWQLGLSSILRYVPDLLIVIGVLITINYWIVDIFEAKGKIIFFFLVFYTLVNLMSALFMSVPLNLVIWSIRKSYRGLFLAFIALHCMEAKDSRRIVSLLFSLQKFNLLIVLFQFFVLGQRRDDIGGMFCGMMGANAYLNIYLVILISFSIAGFLEKTINSRKFFYYIISCVCISAMAELKIFFVELILIIVITVLICRPSMRTFGIIAVGVFVTCIGVYFLTYFFPEQLDAFLSIDGFLNYASMHGGGYNISRLHAFSEINDLFFNNDITKNLFGLGYGNCEMASSIPWFTSDFYNRFGYLNYNWFAHQIIFLQTGYVGIIAIVGLILSFTIYSFKNLNNVFKNDRYYLIGTISFSIILIINIWYNNAIFTEISYVIFPCLMIPPILIKRRERKDEPYEQ